VESPITPPVEENHRPIADFRMSLRSGPAPLEVTFTNKSTDSDGDSITSLWDFGDGSKSTELSPTHVFKQAGEFHIVLIVTDARGAASQPKADPVNVPPPTTPTTTTPRPSPTTPTAHENHPPIADFRTTPHSGPAPLTVTFTNKSTDPDGDSFKSAWDFGDGSKSTAVNPTHVFTQPGTVHNVVVLTNTRGTGSRPREEIVKH